jgi:hypothetical protein
MNWRTAILLLIFASLALWIPSSGWSASPLDQGCCAATATECQTSSSTAPDCTCPCCPAMVSKIPVYASLFALRALMPVPPSPFEIAENISSSARAETPDTPPPRIS